MTVLGGGWLLSQSTPDPDQAEDDLLSLRLGLVLTALDGLAQTLRDLRAPQVFIDAPDLSAIVQAVNGLKPGADADEIAQAVVRQIAPTAQQPTPDVLYSELIDALKKLDFRLKGQGGTGGGLVSDVADRAARQLGHVTVDALPAVSATDNVARVGVPVLVNSTSATPIATPSVGKALRVRWVGFATPDSNSASTVITLTLGATVIYQWPLGAPGAFAHTTVRVGAADEVLTATLSAAQPVYVNVDYEEI